MQSQPVAIAIIPARYASSRFPGKPLALINGKPMIEYVWRAAKRAKSLTEVYVATDDARIRSCVEEFGASVLQPQGEYPSGTDRILAALELIDSKSSSARTPADIIVNIQGDEPLLAPKLVDQLVQSLTDTPDADVSTPVRKIVNTAEIANPAVVKVARAAGGRALYFSRSAIPYDRDGQFAPVYFQHIGLYAYRRAALQRFGSLAPSPLEQSEQLEQLRLLEDGAHYHTVVCNDILVAVDLPGDIQKVEAILRSRD